MREAYYPAPVGQTLAGLAGYGVVRERVRVAGRCLVTVSNTGAGAGWVFWESRDQRSGCLVGTVAGGAYLTLLVDADGWIGVTQMASQSIVVGVLSDDVGDRGVSKVAP